MLPSVFTSVVDNVVGCRGFCRCCGCCCRCHLLLLRLAWLRAGAEDGSALAGHLFRRIGSGACLARLFLLDCRLIKLG
jgi:hypothetical protein